MQNYFDYNYDGPPFDVFGPGHLIALGIIATIIVCMILVRRYPDDTAKRRARFILAGVILVVESSWHVWNLAIDTWNIQRHLPLHTCSMGIWLSIVMLATRNYRLYEILFFIGIAGATQKEIQEFRDELTEDLAKASSQQIVNDKIAGDVYEEIRTAPNLDPDVFVDVTGGHRSPVPGPPDPAVRRPLLLGHPLTQRTCFKV